MQIIEGDMYYSVSIRQVISGTSVEKMTRGQIYDNEGKILAIDIPAKTIYAVPKEIKDSELASSIISEELGIDKSTVLKIFKRNKNFVYISRQVEDNIAKTLKDELKNNKIRGIYYTSVNKRYYPQNEIASKLLGFVNIDRKGAAGLELSLNDELSGNKGVIRTEQDIFNNTKVSINKTQNGNNVYLTINGIIQSFAEEKLKKTVDSLDAKSGIVLMMDPNNGEILTMAEYPNYNNNEFGKYSPSSWLNNSINFSYEPGSVFKLLTAAIAINEDLVSLNEKFLDEGWIDIENGKDRYGNPKYRRIRSWKRDGFGEITLSEAIAVSSNVALIEVGERIPIETYMNYLDNFGIGKRTGINLPAEYKGIIQSEKEIERNVVRANMFIGQGISVTPLQITKAVSEIVNGGYSLDPFLVKKITDNRGTVLSEKIGVKKDKVISEKTSSIIRDIMRDEVYEGTGKRAKIEGYLVGGKTGTAQVAENGKYIDGKYIVSFIGAVPIDNPEIVGIVIINEPKDENPSGGKLAAPIFKDVAREILKYKNILPDIENPDIDLTN